MCARKLTDRSNSKMKLLIYLFMANHSLNSVILHLVDFELLKKVLLVALGFFKYI